MNDSDTIRNLTEMLIDERLERRATEAHRDHLLELIGQKQAEYEARNTELCHRLSDVLGERNQLERGCEDQASAIRQLSDQLASVQAELNARPLPPSPVGVATDPLSSLRRENPIFGALEKAEREQAAARIEAEEKRDDEQSALIYPAFDPAIHTIAKDEREQAEAAGAVVVDRAGLTGNVILIGGNEAQCAIPGCQRPKEPTRLMCGRHWMCLPTDRQTTLVFGQLGGKATDIARWRARALDAVAYVQRSVDAERVGEDQPGYGGTI